MAIDHSDLIFVQVIGLKELSHISEYSLRTVNFSLFIVESVSREEVEGGRDHLDTYFSYPTFDYLCVSILLIRELWKSDDAASIPWLENKVS